MSRPTRPTPRPPTAIAALLAVLALGGAAGCAELQTTADALLRGAQGGRPLDATTAAAGLREALVVGTGRAVERTARVDGFLGDALLRLTLPESLEPGARALRSVGLGSQVDALEVAMNRAAERAAREARGVFGEAIRGMTIEDALAILQGGPTAATGYFRERTAETLVARFRPIADAGMREVGVYRVYDRFRAATAAVPGLTGAAPDLVGSVARQTTDGLFHVLAEEEQRIRADPAARTTELLRRVFGR